MCGFVGVLRDDGRAVTEAELRALLPWIRHRGPDQEGVFVDGPFGVAAARLAIRGGAEGDQPLVADDRVLAFNGELQGWSGGAADSVSFLHTASAHAAFQVAGALVGGMAAFAMYDTVRGQLIVGTDTLGVKPLFKTTDADGTVRFASELKPLLAAAPALRTPDSEGLAELLHFQRPRTRLPFRGVTRIRGVEGLAPGDVSEPSDAETLRQHLEGWVPHAADVDGPVSLFLSGGLDSSAVAALAGRDDLLCLTGRFAPHGGALDESDLAADVAAAAGLRHEIVDLRDEDLLLDLPDVIAALEVPMMGPGSLSLWRMAKRAREHGKVVLTGTGGDELFGGYARTALALGRAGPWTKGYEPLRARIEAAGSDPEARLRACFSRFDDLQPFLAPDFLRSLPSPAPITVADGESLFDALVREERDGTLPSLLDVDDRVTSAHGLEGRPVPCLGRVPVAARQMEQEQLVGPDGEGKRVLREALRGLIPEHVRTNKTKRGFPTPFARAARGAGRDVAMDLLHDRRFACRGWWNVDACRALLDEERPLHDRALWAVLSWETWARLFLDGDLFKEPPGQ